MFQRVQMEEMQPSVRRARMVAEHFDLRAERAFAFLYDALMQHGSRAARTELHLMLANRTTLSNITTTTYCG